MLKQFFFFLHRAINVSESKYEDRHVGFNSFDSLVRFLLSSRIKSCSVIHPNTVEMICQMSFSVHSLLM